MTTDANAKTDGQLDLLDDKKAAQGAGARGPGGPVRTNLRWSVGELTMLVESLARGETPEQIAAFLRRSVPGVRRIIARLMEEGDDKVIGIAALAQTTRATLAEVRRKAKVKRPAFAKGTRSSTSAGRSAQDRALHAELLRKLQDVTTSIQNVRAAVESDRRLGLTCMAVEMAGRLLPPGVLETFPISAQEREQVLALAAAIREAAPEPAPEYIFPRE